MSYTIQNKDIVIGGFQGGINDSVYSGPADMRNVELMTVPGEVSVALGTAQIVQPPAINSVAFAAVSGANTVSLVSVAGLYNSAAIVLNTSSASGPSTGVVYYVQDLNVTSNDFKISTDIAGTHIVTISGSGTGTLSTYQFGATFSPVAYLPDTTGGISGSNAVYLTDENAHVWMILAGSIGSIPANTLIFLGNIGGVAASGTTIPTGLAIWQGYLFLLGTTTSGTDIVKLSTLLTTASASTWTYNWNTLRTVSNNGAIDTLISLSSGNLYWTSTGGVDSLTLTPGGSFDPSNTATYTINESVVTIEGTDQATCLAQLGGLILIGGQETFLYTWNELDPSFSGLINVPDAYTAKIVATNQNAYVFAGIRGKIYITNGSGMDLFKKIPDYVTGTLNPLFEWQDASFGRNQLYFSFDATSAAGTVLNTTSGAWVIDLDTNSLRMLNKTSASAYTGTVRMVTQRPPQESGFPNLNVTGNNLIIGWYTSSTSTIDYSTADPYQNGESYVETDVIPVGTHIDPFTPSQIEWKTAAPLVAGESISIYARGSIGATAYTLIGTSNTVGLTSDVFKANFQKVEWVQFKIVLTSVPASSNPSYVRLTQIRIREYPSGNQPEQSLPITV